MRRLGLIAIALATLGLVLSLLLERLHVSAYLAPNDSTFCSVSEKLNCTSVALSRYSVLLGIPLPLWGALGFFAIGAAVVAESRWLLPLTALAAFSSLAFLIVELLYVGALCLLCEGVHAVSFGLFGVALATRRHLGAPFGDRKKLLAVFAVPVLGLGLLVAFLPRYWGAFGWKGELPFPHGKTAEGYPWIGAVAPTVTLHEFTDYRCAHCKAAAARNLMRLSEHPSSLRIVRRQFPRMRCPKRPNFGCIAIRMAYCAEEQGKFWQADRWLFEHGSRPEHVDKDAFARELRLDARKLEECLERSDLALRAAAEAQLGLDQHFSGTPAYVVDGRTVPESVLDEKLSGLR